MAKNKGKGGKSKGYISKGERPNINRRLSSEIRRERKKNRPMADIIHSMEHRRRIIVKPQNKKERELRDRYLEQDRVESVAGELLLRFGAAGLTRAAAIQAVKTDFVPSLVNKWKPRMAAYVQAQKEQKRRLESLKYTGANLGLMLEK